MERTIFINSYFKNLGDFHILEDLQSFKNHNFDSISPTLFADNFYSFMEFGEKIMVLDTL